ncbi:hypothetical protein Pen01_54650 [Phytomonospora endophytica]|nr:hypothetical protein Pen01_54650 [Phytomonospora endophytica]
MRSPDRVALEQGERRVTYAELDRAAGVLAARLLAKGVTPGSVVGILVERSPETAVAILGVLKCGAAYLPLDPTHPEERVEYIVGHAGPMFVLTGTNMDRRLPAGVEAVPLMAPDVEGGNVAPSTGGLLDPAHLAYVMYTSGSTGRPKGVMLPHSAVVNFIRTAAEDFTLTARTRFLQFTTYTFDVSVCDLLAPLAAGSTVVFPPADTDLASAELLSLMRVSAVTHAIVTPSLLAVLPDAELPDLCTLAVIGEACTRDVAVRWGRGRRFLNTYGPTEAAVLCSFGEHLPAQGPPPIGLPTANVDLFVLDERGDVVSPGTVGELWIGGRGLARGYLGAPALTADRFRPDAYSGRSGARLYGSGDLVHWLPDGELAYVGRVDDQVKVRGFRVEPGEIEEALVALPEVRAAAVIVNGDGAGAKLVAFVVSDGFSTEELRAGLRPVLPQYMIPSVFIAMDTLPVNSNGKVDRPALRAVALPEGRAGLPYSAPRGVLEEDLARVWSAVLVVDPVGRDDRFMDLGGTSLQATQVVSRVRAELGLHVTVRALFEAQTIARLAPALQDAAPGRVLPAVRRGAGAAVPSVAQQALWLDCEMRPELSVAYNMPAVLRIRGELDVGALRAALGDLLARHDALRTGFCFDGWKLAARVVDAAEPELLLIDAVSEAEAFEVARGMAARPFELGNPPLVRSVLVRLAPGDHLLVTVFHHLVFDGWSLRVWDDDLAACYAARVAGRVPRLSAPVLRFADFAHWEEETESAGAMSEGVSYWRRQLTGAPSVLDLPTDHRRPAESSSRGGQVRRPVDAELHKGIAALAQEAGATAYAVHVTALAVVLAGLTGRSELLIGSPVAGRPSAALEKAIGYFVNTVPLRVRLDAARTFGQTVASVGWTVVDALEHQYVPFSRIVREAEVERAVGGRPLIQVVLTYQGIRRPSAGLSGLVVERVALHNGTCKFDLMLDVEDVLDGGLLSLDFDVDLFTTVTAERLIDEYLAVLRAAIADPRLPVSHVLPGFEG